MGVKMNFRIRTKNLATDREIGFLTKSILKTNGRAAAIPTSWELIWKNFSEALCNLLFSNQT